MEFGGGVGRVGFAGGGSEDGEVMLVRIASFGRVNDLNYNSIERPLNVTR